MTPLPASVATEAALDAWPDDPARRAHALRGLSPDARVDLYAWAHAAAGDAPTLDAWAAVLGVPVATLRGLRHRRPELAALPVTMRAPGPPRGASPSPAALASRARREAAKRPKRRRAKAVAR